MQPIGTPVGEGIVYIDQFLPAEHCRQILEELEVASWEPSLTYERQKDGKYRDVISPRRLGRSALPDSFSKNLIAILKGIEKRLQKLFGVDPACLETWQAADYRRNGKFEYHLDAGYWDEDDAGDRILTFLLYLNTPAKGGGTHFRVLDKYVSAKAGRLLVWENLLANGDCNRRMIHSGTPVLKGRKTTLVNWQRQNAYRNPK
jgi:prolyl 4-hydroxylase